MSNKKVYVTTKVVLAEPMTKLQALGSAEVKDTLKALESEQGYEVEYPDGYMSWCPKEEFERTSRPMSEKEEDLVVEHM